MGSANHAQIFLFVLEQLIQATDKNLIEIFLLISLYCEEISLVDLHMIPYNRFNHQLFLIEHATIAAFGSQLYCHIVSLLFQDVITLYRVGKQMIVWYLEGSCLPLDNRSIVT